MILKEIIEKMKNRLIEIQQKDIKDTYFEIQQILIDLEKANELQEEMISELIKLYKVNQNINNIIIKYNRKSKEKILLDILDLMNEIEIEDFLEKLLNKSWEEIIKEK